MTVNVSWDDDDRTIIRVDFVGAWTWQELQRGIAKLATMRQEVDYDVNVIGDVSYSGRLPSSFLTQLRRFIQNRPPGVDLTVLVGMNEVMQIFWKILLRTSGWVVSENRMIVAKTIEEARVLIAARMEKARLSA